MPKSTIAVGLAALWCCVPLVVSGAEGEPEAATDTITLRFEVQHEDTGAPLPCRIHLSDGTETLFAPPDAPAFKNHFACTGVASLNVPPGEYTYAIERGPEYTRVTGALVLATGLDALVITETLRPLVDLGAEGWWSGDLHIHRPPEQIEAIMRAEDLHVAPVITWWNKRNLWRDRPLPDPVLVRFDEDRFYQLMAGEDERDGGAFMIFNLESPVDITKGEKHYPCQTYYLKEAWDRGAWIDLEKPFWWDGPIGIGLGYVDSIGLANNHMWRHGMLDNEAWGRPRLRETDPPAHGNGLWTQEIYYHVLNAGLRIPPSAGSASGVIPNPVGYNRVYVQLDDPLTYQAWWEGLRAGRSFVTNGPLLRVKANGEWPGHVFNGGAGESVSINLTGTLDSNDPVRHIQIIKDGEIALEVPVAQFLDESMPNTVTFDQSGWFLVRAIADVDFTFRFASSAPFYVEIGDEPRQIQRESVRFFLDWIDERNSQIDLPEAQKAEVMQLHDKARAFWRATLEE